MSRVMGRDGGQEWKASAHRRKSTGSNRSPTQVNDCPGQGCLSHTRLDTGGQQDSVTGGRRKGGHQHGQSHPEVSKDLGSTLRD